MKKIIACATIAAFAASVQAAVIHFGAPNTGATNWIDAVNMTTVDNGDGSVTYTKAQDGVTFALTLTGYTNYTGTAGTTGITAFGNGAGLGVTGGTSVSASTRISNNTAGDTTDDEYIEAKLSVSGTPLDSLSLYNLNIRYTGGRNQHFIDHDGGPSFSSESGTADWNYSSLTGLTALNKDNVSDWSLAMGLIDDSGSNANDVSAYGQISFEYTIPEPATLGLVTAMGGSILFIRRRFMM